MSQVNNIRVLDSTWLLPNSPFATVGEFSSAGEAFHAGHIPTAQRWDLDQIADTQFSPTPHNLPSSEQFADAVAQCGIDDETIVVCYDGFGMFSAPRLWYTLRAFGHKQVAVLEGGYPAWLAASGDVETGPVKAPENVKTMSWHKIHAVQWSLDEMKANIGDKPIVQTVDLRPAGRFNASAPEPRQGMRGGHMPGSISIPFIDLLCVEEGVKTMKPPVQLARMFEEQGVDIQAPMVASCGSGMTAALLGLAVEQIPEANSDFSLYDGSWNEWGGLEDTMVVTADGTIEPAPK